MRSTGIYNQVGAARRGSTFNQSATILPLYWYLEDWVVITKIKPNLREWDLLNLIQQGNNCILGRCNLFSRSAYTYKTQKGFGPVASLSDHTGIYNTSNPPQNQRAKLLHCSHFKFKGPTASWVIKSVLPQDGVQLWSIQLQSTLPPYCTRTKNC